MADIEAGQFSTVRRVDVGTPAAMVLTVDAVALLVVAVVGVPFLAFFFGDEDGGWQRLWPLFTGWFVAALLGAACTAAVFGLAGHGRFDARRTGIAAALGTAVASPVVAVTATANTTLLLLALPFAAANLAVAAALRYPERTAGLAVRLGFGRTETEPVDTAESGPGDLEPTNPQPGEPELNESVPGESGPGDREIDGLENEPEFDEFETESDRVAVRAAPEQDAAGEPAEGESRPTLDLQIGATRAARTRAAVLKRRTRGQAALRTFDGVRLPRRARTRR